MIEEVEKGDAYEEVRDAVKEEAVVLGELGHREVLALLDKDEGAEEGTREGSQKLKDHCTQDVEDDKLVEGREVLVLEDQSFHLDCQEVVELLEEHNNHGEVQDKSEEQK